ncbi:MAG: PD-(D/E)XK nuclease family protein, partial [Bryobacteraceae bacterium]
AVLLEEWNRELYERGFADYAHCVELAVEEAAQASARALLLIDPGLRSTAERELLNVLEQRAPAALRLGVDRKQSLPTNALTSVQRYALSGERAPMRDADPSISFLSASSEALECVEIARRVLDSGVPFDCIAVLLRNPVRQVPLLEEAFSRAGIPAWFEGGLQRPDTSGQGFLALLHCREERFSAARFSEYLALAPLPHEDEQSLAPSQWERLLNDAAVIAGHERWHSRLEAEAFRASEAYERAPSERLARRIGALESLRGFALPIIDRLRALPQDAPWREWITSLEELARTALRYPRTVHEALEELAPVSDTGPVSFGEVLRILERLISGWRQEPEGDRYGKVFVAQIDDARGMDFRLVFVPGLNEGLFPRALREDPLLLDQQRDELEMPGSRDEHELLDIALSAASESAVFSWARLDLATGRERVPSFFAAEVIAAACGADADIHAMFSEAKGQVGSKIGWSAPEDPVDSIDDSEYDLASFRQACKEKTGMAWLRKVNPHTVRAIHARHRRWSRDWSDADGLNADCDMQVALALERWKLTEHPYAPTSLNQFARCPYRFYLSAVAGLRPVEPPRIFERLSPVTRGHLYHQTLFRFFRSGGGRSLDAVLQALAAEAAEKLAPPIEGVWVTEIEKLRADLHASLTCRDPEWTPCFVELAFGLPDAEECDPASVPAPVTIEGGWQICGSIDLVERHSDGRLRVIDHKTGTPDKKDWSLCTGKGEVLQPVLYGLALEALGHATPVSASLSWATLRGGFRSDHIKMDVEARTRIVQVLRAIESYLNRGFLPAAPRADACRNCEYLPVCGPWEEARLDLKDHGELKTLQEIRRLR